MKKLLLVSLALIMVFSCTACSLFSKGHPETHESAVLDFVKKYYGDATVVSQETTLLDTSSTFKLKDTKDGFEYYVSIMEVPMTDLGFAAVDESEAAEYTTVIDGDFYAEYLRNLMETKVDKAAISVYMSENNTVVTRSSTKTIFEGFSTPTLETAFVSKDTDETAIKNMAKYMLAADERNILTSMMLPVYNESTDGAAIVAYYSFFFDRLVSKDEFNDIALIHDYLYNSGYRKATIKSLKTDVKSSSLTVDNDWNWISKESEDSYTYFVVEIDGKEYELYTQMATKVFNTEHDEFGVFKGSFVDIMTHERCGARTVGISMYASSYPEFFGNLAIYFKPLDTKTESKPDNESSDESDAVENSKTETSEEVSE